MGLKVQMKTSGFPGIEKGNRSQIRQNLFASIFYRIQKIFPLSVFFNRRPAALHGRFYRWYNIFYYPFLETFERTIDIFILPSRDRSIIHLKFYEILPWFNIDINNQIGVLIILNLGHYCMHDENSFSIFR